METENTEHNKLIQPTSETPDPKRNLLNEKGNFLLIISVLVIVGVIVLGIYKFKSNPSQTNTQNQVTNQQSSNLTPPNMISKDLFAGLKRPKIDQQSQKLLFTDGGIYGYQMDFSDIPEATITNADGPGYPFPTYEFDMYKLKEPNKASVARFTFSIPMENQDNLTLEDFAKQKFEYKEGRTEGGYGGPSITSKITPIDLTNKKGIAWDTQLESKVFFSKHYLIEQNGKLIYSTMYSWTEPNFQKALVQYKKVVSSLNITKDSGAKDKDVFYLWTQQKPNDVLAQYPPYGDVGESVPVLGSGWQPNTE